MQPECLLKASDRSDDLHQTESWDCGITDNPAYGSCSLKSPKRANLNREPDLDNQNLDSKWCRMDRSYASLKPLADFLISCTSFPQLLMWGFLAWYMSVVFASLPLNPKPFKDAFVIMALIGLVLNANAFVAYQHHIQSCPVSTFEPTFAVFLRRQPASIARLFIIPYCVSCYSGIANSTPGFVSIFPTDPAVLVPAIFGFFAFPLSLRLTSDILSHLVYPVESKAHRNQRRRASVDEIKF